MKLAKSVSKIRPKDRAVDLPTMQQQYAPVPQRPHTREAGEMFVDLRSTRLREGPGIGLEPEVEPQGNTKTPSSNTRI